MAVEEEPGTLVERLEDCIKLLHEQLKVSRDWKFALRNGVLYGLGAFLGATIGAALVIALLRPVLEPIGLERIIEALESPRRDRPPLPTDDRADVSPAPGG